MLYIFTIIIISMILFFIIIYNKVIKNQNEIIKVNNREYNEDTPYKKFLPKITLNIICIYVLSLFIIFIISRIIICGQSETEYKDLTVVIPNEELTINDNEYLVYINGELNGFNKGNTNVIIDKSATKPYIKNYYQRTTKLVVKNYKLFFLYNRKKDKIGEWEVVHSSCVCGGREITLVLPDTYKLKIKKSI